MRASLMRILSANNELVASGLSCLFYFEPTFHYQSINAQKHHHKKARHLNGYEVTPNS